MQNIHCILETEAIFSDDNQHRYLLKKTWDKDKKSFISDTLFRINRVVKSNFLVPSKFG
jgi:hypothetical protein